MRIREDKCDFMIYAKETPGKTSYVSADSLIANRNKGFPNSLYEKALKEPRKMQFK